MSRLCVWQALLLLSVGSLPPLPPPAQAALPQRAVSFRRRANAHLGTILVSGNAVYTLRASKVPCGTECLKIWPEVLLPKGVTTTTAGPGVKATSLGTVTRGGGALQVTYRGKPLYYFFKDTRAGQVGGNLTDKWGKWSVVVTVKPSTRARAGLRRRAPVQGGSRSSATVRDRYAGMTTISPAPAQSVALRGADRTNPGTHVRAAMSSRPFNQENPQLLGQMWFELTT